MKRSWRLHRALMWIERGVFILIGVALLVYLIIFYVNWDPK